MTEIEFELQKADSTNFRWNLTNKLIYYPYKVKD